MSENKPRLFKSMWTALAALGIAATAVVAAHAPARANEGFAVKPTQVFKLPAKTLEKVATKPLTSFDISFTDNAAGVYVLADRSNSSIDMIDLNFGTVRVLSPLNSSCVIYVEGVPNCAFQGPVTDPNAGPINDVSGPNGEATVNDREIWAGDAPTFPGAIQTYGTCGQGASTQNLADCAHAYIDLSGDRCDSSVKVINLRSQQVIDTISTGGCFRADEVAFDPKDQVFIVANDAEQDIGNPDFITLISAKPGHAILKKIAFDGTNGTPNATGGIEQPVWDPTTDRFYIATPADGGTFDSPSSVGAVAVVDPRKGHENVTNVISVNNCTPNGIAIGPNNQAVLGCNAAAPVQIIDLKSGQTVASIPQINGGCDEVWYEAGQNHYLTACSTHNANPPPYYVVGVIDAGDGKKVAPSWDQNITTKSTATASSSPHSVAADDFTSRILVPLGKNSPECGKVPNNGCVAAWSSLTPGDADDSDRSIASK
jgi:hypothetical protein